MFQDFINYIHFNYYLKFLIILLSVTQVKLIIYKNLVSSTI